MSKKTYSSRRVSTGPTYIDLFAGCGGLSLGLHKAGWKGVFAIEKSKDAFETLRHNLIDKLDHFDWPEEWLEKKNHDIKEILKNNWKQLEDLKGKVDLVTGGPPCQGFSTAGKRNEADKRNKLIKSYIKFISLVKPKILFFENVKGFTMDFDRNKSKGKKYSSYVINALKRAGYNVYGTMVDFSHYGVPQKRCRFILVGIQKEISEKNGVFAKDFFDLIFKNRLDFLSSKNLSLTPNLEEAISDLLMKNGTTQSPDTNGFKAGIYSKARSNYQSYLRSHIKEGEIADSHRFVNHSDEITNRFLHFLKVSKKNKIIDRTLKKKYNLKKRVIVPLDAKSPSPTITTLPDDYIHYVEPRILTVREYARIQSFPDNYEFKGKYTTGGKQRVLEVPRYTQIGNAIPPLFGEQSGLVLKQLIH